MWFRSFADFLKPRPPRAVARRTRRRPKACGPRLQVLEDRCLPSFLTPVNYAVGTAPVAVVTADLGNGKLDIITANATDNTISVRLGKGDGTFGPATTYAVGSGPNSLAVGDVNGDGKLDVVTANAGGNTVSVLLGNGDGTLQAARSNAVGSAPVSVAVGNFDGRPDIVTANAGDGSVSLLPGNGDGTFGATKTLASFSAPPASVAVGDFNSDGKLDLAVATRGTDGFAWTGGYYGGGYYPGNYPAVTVLLGNGTGGFTTGSSYSLPTPYWRGAWWGVPPSSYAPPSMTTANLNGDGAPDLVITDAGDGEVEVLLGKGDGTFGWTSFSTGGHSPDSVAVVDLNGDGKLDLLTANSGNTVSVLPGDGKGAFGAPYTFTVGSGPASVAAGDFNGDGKTDAAVANSGDNNVSVLLNNGYWPSLQVSATDSGTGAAIRSVTAGKDFNLTVTADDPAGNVLAGYTGTVSFGTSDAHGTIVDPATGKVVSLAGFTYTFTAADHGTHTFRVDLTTANAWQPNQSIDVSDASVGLAPTGPVIAVYPGAVGGFTISGFPSPTTAGADGQFTVSPYDAYGNLAYNYTGTVILASTDPQATINDPTTGNRVALAGFTYAFSPYDYGTAYFTAAFNRVGNQSIAVRDSANPNATGSQTGIRVDLGVAISGPSGSYLNQTLTFALATLGDPAGTVFTYKIDWNGDGIVDQTVTGPSGSQVTHAFSTAGYSNFTVTATDPNGLTGSASGYDFTAPVTVAIQTDPARTSQQMLVIKDSDYGANIVVASAANNGVALTIDGYNVGTIVPTNGKPFALVMALSSATGYETLDASSLAISSVLVGGSGYNWLYGGSARNLLIAGTGVGYLSAGSAGDILIGGTTKYNGNTTALAYIMAEWGSGDSYSTRVSKISKGGGLNGAYVLNGTTVSANSVNDSLYGGAGLDWFFAHTKGKKNSADKIYNQTSGETVTQI